jgi:hypothetical protein
MPKKLEEHLKHEANTLGLEGERKDAYIYGTMRKTGWVPSTQKNAGRKSKKNKKK